MRVLVKLVTFYIHQNSMEKCKMEILQIILRVVFWNVACSLIVLLWE